MLFNLPNICTSSCRLPSTLRLICALASEASHPTSTGRLRATQGPTRSALVERVIRDERKIVVITGPTAVGKTKVSLEIAKRLGGEIISADSVQVYRGLDVGSDKVPHY